MTQAISVYISKAISGPTYTQCLIETGKQLKYVTHVKPLLCRIYGIKLLQLEYLMSVICSYI